MLRLGTELTVVGPNRMERQKTERFRLGPTSLSTTLIALTTCLLWLGMPRLGAAIGPEESEPRGWLGVQLAELSETSTSDAPDSEGVKISAVIPGSPADGTLRENDTLLEVSGRQVGSLTQLREALTGHAPGDNISVVIIRDGARKTLQVTLSAVPSPSELTEARLEGRRLPPFLVEILHSPEGRSQTETSSRALTGTFTLVEFWATWCPPCEATRALLTDLKSTYGAALRILAISPESEETIEGMLADHDLLYDVARDPGGTAQKVCGVGQFPTIIAIGRDGTVLDVFVGADHGEAIRSLTAKHLE